MKKPAIIGDKFFNNTQIEVERISKKKLKSSNQIENSKNWTHIMNIIYS